MNQIKFSSEDRSLIKKLTAAINKLERTIKGTPEQSFTGEPVRLSEESARAIEQLAEPL